MACLFCQIINKEKPAEVIYEDKQILVIKDIQPAAPIHYLAIPKRHISSVNDLAEADKDLIGDLILTAKKVAREAGISESGYRLVFNTGQGAGQTIFHLHLHILGGKTLSWP